MIENANTSEKVFFDDESDIAIGGGKSGSLPMSEVLDDLEERRKTVLDGGINCIPFPFERFRAEIPGIEQEQYIVITSGMKMGKTQIASFIYLYSTLDYAFTHKDKCSVHIIYIPMEESEMRVKHRYICHLLYQLDGIRISPTDLRSTSSEFPLPEEILRKLRSPKYTERLKFFDECVQFETEDTNPTGILRVCEEYAKKVGEYKTYKRRSKSNPNQVIEVFQSYKPYNKNHYKIVLIDHIGLTDPERGMTTKQTIDKLSEYCVKYLRNRFKYTVVSIQQQAMEIEGLEAFKQKKMVPSVAALGDSKYTARDANDVFGLFDPSFFGLPSHLGYKIADVDNQGLRNYCRFLYHLRGRDGEQGGICPLFFDGAVCQFEELPPADDVNELAKYYARVNQLKAARQQRKFASLLTLIKNHFK